MSGTLALASDMMHSQPNISLSKDMILHTDPTAWLGMPTLKPAWKVEILLVKNGALKITNGATSTHHAVTPRRPCTLTAPITRTCSNGENAKTGTKLVHPTLSPLLPPLLPSPPLLFETY